MSVANVRSRMTHRALVERDTQSDTNADGHLGPPSWATHIASQPCWLYVSTARAGRESVTPDRTVGVDQLMALMPVGTDVTRKDRISGIVDRQGNSVLDGILNIRSVIRHTHQLELMLEKAS